MNIFFTIFLIIWFISGSIGCYLDFYHTNLTWKFELNEHISAFVLILLASASGFLGLYVGLNNYFKKK